MLTVRSHFDSHAGLVPAAVNIVLKLCVDEADFCGGNVQGLGCCVLDNDSTVTWFSCESASVFPFCQLGVT